MREEQKQLKEMWERVAPQKLALIDRMEAREEVKQVLRDYFIAWQQEINNMLSIDDLEVAFKTVFQTGGFFYMCWSRYFDMWITNRVYNKYCIEEGKKPSFSEFIQISYVKGELHKYNGVHFFAPWPEQRFEDPRKKASSYLERDLMRDVVTALRYDFALVVLEEQFRVVDAIENPRETIFILDRQIELINDFFRVFLDGVYEELYPIALEYDDIWKNYPVSFLKGEARRIPDSVQSLREMRALHPDEL
jgi:hypothetical protein